MTRADPPAVVRQQAAIDHRAPFGQCCQASLRIIDTLVCGQASEHAAVFRNPRRPCSGNPVTTNRSETIDAENMNIHALPMQPTKTLFLFFDWCYFLFASAASGFSDYGCLTIRLFFTVVFGLGWVCFEGVFCFAKYNPASC